LRETASYELSCVKITSVDFPVEDGKKKREGKGRHKKSRKRYISPIRGEAPRKQIFTKLHSSGDMLDVIICANFGVEKLRGLGNTMGQILEFPIEMAGHLYNRAVATAQPVIDCTLNTQKLVNLVLLPTKLCLLILTYPTSTFCALSDNFRL